MKKFPVDIWSVKKYGVEEWYQTLFWPVPDKELRSLYNDVDEFYIKIINQADPELGDAMSVIFNLIVDYYVSFVHVQMVVKRLRQAGFSIEYSPSARHYSEVVNADQGMLALTRKGFPPRSPSTKERVRGRIRTVLENIKYHKLNLNSYFEPSRKQNYLCFYYPDRDKQLYANSHGKKITIVHPRQFMPKGPFAPANLPKLEPTVRELISGVREIAEKYGVYLDVYQIEHFQDLTMTSLGLVGDYITQIRELLHSREPTSFLVQGLGNIFKRSLCVAGRREGFKMVGFTHGNTVGMNSFGTFSYVDLAITDAYVVPTKASVKLFSKLQKRYPVPYDRQVEIVSSDNEVYKKIWQENRKKALPSSIKTVMVIESPITGNLDRDVYFFWPYQVELILRVGKLMRKWGFKTILKRHPDRLAESEGVYDSYFDELMVEPFEKVYDKADALFYPYISSTTFGFSLLTNKTIIFLEEMLGSVWNELHDPLKKRCRVVPSWLDSTGKLMFNQDMLRDALQKEPGPPDEDFVQKYMFP